MNSINVNLTPAQVRQITSGLMARSGQIQKHINDALPDLRHAPHVREWCEERDALTDLARDLNLATFDDHNPHVPVTSNAFRTEDDPR